jgi:two-component system phosphate regulon sensor histidine kinase PhoR
MIPARFARKYDERRLRNLLLGLLVALAIPTGAVIWQAYDQLKWESWYQYRNQAESLVRQIDFAIAEDIADAESREFNDFTFLVSAGSSNVQRRSPLSEFPVPADLPGLIGYFQVDPDGGFSTPLLPGDDANPADIGLPPQEVADRSGLAQSLRQILADNQLVIDNGRLSGSLRRETPETSPPGESVDGPADQTTPERNTSAAVNEAEPPPRARLAESRADETFDRPLQQRAFDNLNQPAVALESATLDDADVSDYIQESDPEAGVVSLGKMRDLRLDENLEKRNAERARQEVDDESIDRRTTGAAPQSIAPAAPAAIEAGKEEASMAITTFDSEVDPFQFSLLGSGHMVLYRNAWQHGGRYIQGMLLDQSTFSAAAIERSFQSSTLAGMSDLIVGYRDDVIAVIRGGSYDGLATSATELSGSLLYRSALSAPFDSLELVIAVNRMPAGPGASVLAWTSLVIAIVFAGGFFAMYRLGVEQIRLARQQQDFVSAVSHELKTPLTSIRMYGEMLKEGWADADKQKQYFDYIHDESERLTRLISNVLQLAKITRDEPQISRKPIAVSQLLDQVRSKIANQVESAGFALDIKADAKATEASVEIDDDCFAQIMINLVDNAIKFSRDADSLEIELRANLSAGDRVCFAIRDYGPGIPPDQLKKIFKLFYRSESELTRETVGTGIGLAIVHQLCTAMGGDVDVVNRDPGAEFRVCFPTC